MLISGIVVSAQAVCCTDHEHCCPQGYTCNMQTGTCEKKQHYHHLSTIPQIEVLQSVKEAEDEEEDVACDGRGEFRCSKRDTCCKISATEWSCCPSPRVRSPVSPSHSFTFEVILPAVTLDGPCSRLDFGMLKLSRYTICCCATTHL